MPVNGVASAIERVILLGALITDEDPSTKRIELPKI